jgi:hypothetical protein
VIAASTIGAADRLVAGESLPEPTVPAPPATRAAAERNLELAELRLLRFDRIDYPLAQKRLENEIEMTKAEIDSRKRRIAEYDRFNHSAYSSPFFYTLEENRLALKDAELRLDMLLRERCLRVQYKGTMRRIRELEVEQSRDWVDRLAD